MWNVDFGMVRYNCDRMKKRMEWIRRIETNFFLGTNALNESNPRKIRLNPPNPFHPFFHFIATVFQYLHLKTTSFYEKN